MDNLRRGVDRAGFEVDRMLRANRVRSEIGNVRSQIDEQFRQIGRQIMEMYDRNATVPEQVRALCEQVRQYEAEIAQREVELEAINNEVPTDAEPAPPGVATPKCWNCGQPVSAEAKFCSHCGSDLSAVGRAGTAASPSVQPEAEPGPAQTGLPGPSA
jgi:hypothetical protein